MSYQLPTVSIITVCYNSEATIFDCIESINSQSYKKIQHIIIDGASTDSTLSVVKKNACRSPQVISEIDNGIYDAMNKGLEKANGIIIGFLNSDDMYYDNEVISTVVSEYLDQKASLIWGDLIYVDRKDVERTKRIWNSSNLKIDDLEKGLAPPHPSFFFVPSQFADTFRFNLNYKLAADFDFMLRLLLKANNSTSYIPRTLVKMRLGGATNISWSNILKQNVEIIKSIKSNTGQLNIIKFLATKFQARVIQIMTKSL